MDEGVAMKRRVKVTIVGYYDIYDVDFPSYDLPTGATFDDALEVDRNVSTVDDAAYLLDPELPFSVKLEFDEEAVSDEGLAGSGEIPSDPEA